MTRIIWATSYLACCVGMGLRVPSMVADGQLSAAVASLLALIVAGLQKLLLEGKGE